MWTWLISFPILMRSMAVKQQIKHDRITYIDRFNGVIMQELYTNNCLQKLEIEGKTSAN